MRFVVDNNLSPNLAKGMESFGEPVSHLRDYFPPETPDVEWLEHIGKEGFFLVTRDLRIRWNPAELAALREHAVGAFYLGGKNLDRCRLIQQLVRNWPRIKEYAARERRPFGFRVPPKGKKFSKVPIR